MAPRDYEDGRTPGDPPDRSDEVGAFWDRTAADYHRVDRPANTHRDVAAGRLNERLAGDILCAGGLWDGAELDPARHRVTVLDVSAAMLGHYEQHGVTAVLGDARSMPFGGGSFDHLVLPFVLHHVTGSGARDARRFLRGVLREAARVLRPGGHIWVNEVVVPPPVYAAELALAQVTRRVLALRRVPLVILHGRRFLLRSLRQAGFSELDSLDCTRSPGGRWELVRPVVGVPALRVPRWLIPIRYLLISGTRRRDGLAP